MNDKENKKENVEDIEVVIGDDSILNISEVGDMMNDLRPQDSIKKRKNFIIPIAKKKKDKKEENK